jgi:APA family basic amino acid/polyamine antiporter
MGQDKELVRGLGPWAATALVAGNIIGSGIYVIPGSLAEIAGPASLVAWGVTALGFLALTAVFSDLGGAYPISGGPQAFVQRAFGDLAGLEASFLYWVSTITTNAAYATGFVAYLAIFFPSFAASLPAQIAGQALLWTFCGVNACGVRAVGHTQLVGTLLKAAPLVILAIALFAVADVDNLAPFAPHGIGAVLPAIGLVSFLFLGSESATVPAEEVRGGGPAVRRAGYRGYGVACGVFFLLVIALALGVPSGAIAGSASPLAIAAERALGPWGQWFLTLGALVSIAGALNGWTLVAARMPFAAARAGIAPAALGRIDPRTGTPLLSLLLSTACASALLLLTFQQSLLHAFNFIVLLSTATTLLALGGCCAAEFVLLRREPEYFTPTQRRRGGLTACVGFVMVGVMMAGTGMQVMLLALLTMAPPLAYRRWGMRGHNT